MASRSPAVVALDHRRAQPRGQVGLGGEVALAAEGEAVRACIGPADVELEAPADRVAQGDELADVAVAAVHADQVRVLVGEAWPGAPGARRSRPTGATRRRRGATVLSSTARR